MKAVINGDRAVVELDEGWLLLEKIGGIWTRINLIAASVAGSAVDKFLFRT